MKIVAVAIAALLLAAGAQAARPPEKPPGAVSCIDPRQMGGSSAEGEDTIIFHVGTKTYRNKLASECPGLWRLNQFGSLETEPWGAQLCQGDSVRVFDQNAVRGVGIGAYPRCRLGWFEPIDSAKPAKPQPARP